MPAMFVGRSNQFKVPRPDAYVASARLLAELLDVPWAESGLGPFSQVYVKAA